MTHVGRMYFNAYCRIIFALLRLNKEKNITLASMGIVIPFIKYENHNLNSKGFYSKCKLMSQKMNGLITKSRKDHYNYYGSMHDYALKIGINSTEPIKPNKFYRRQLFKCILYNMDDVLFDILNIYCQLCSFHILNNLKEILSQYQLQFPKFETTKRLTCLGCFLCFIKLYNKFLHLNGRFLMGDRSI